MSRSPRDPETQALIEDALVAKRQIAPDGTILPHPAWADLSEEAREALFEETGRARVLERCMDPRGWSNTVRAVLGRLYHG